MNGACSMPASRRLKLMERKMGWALTSEAPPPWQPSLSVGSLARSWGIKKLLKTEGSDRRLKKKQVVGLKIGLNLVK